MDREEKKIIASPDGPPPVGPYSPAVAAGGFLFISGQIAPDAAAPAAAQARAALESVGRLLTAAGAGYRDVVKTTVYLTDLGDFAAVNEVYAEFFPAAPPARACVEVRRLPREVRVEIEALARLPAGAG